MKDKNYGYIYETINKINGKFYIGKFKGEFNSDYHGSGILLNQAINKYGKNNFFTRLIKYAKNKEQLNNMEKEYILIFRKEYGKKRMYNIANGGEGGATRDGFKASIKTRKKMSLSKVGKVSSFKGHHFTEEAKEKSRQSHLGKSSGMCDKYHTKETKEKMRQAKLGKKRIPFTEEHKKKISENHKGMLGKCHSIETKEKLRNAALGNTYAVKKNKNFCDEKQIIEKLGVEV